MKVLLTSAYHYNEPINTAYQLAEQDKHRKHELVHDPEQADLILFVESSQYSNDILYTKLINHPYVQRYPTKTLMYNEQDKPIIAIPGLFVSLNKQKYDPIRQKATVFVKDVNESIEKYARLNPEPDILYSFMGGRKTRVRHQLFAMSHPRGIVKDTSDFSIFWPDQFKTERVPQQKEEYAELLVRSKFVLCPKGAGLSSYRLFETMQSRRVPVILSDNWVPPEGPNWNNFAIFVSENDVINIQNILEKHETSWREKGKIARSNWDEYFAPNARFHYYVEQCKVILENSKGNPDFFKHRVTKYEIYMRLRLALAPLIAKIEPIVYPLIRRSR